MQNQRQHVRTKTYIGARIEQPHPLGTVDCIVRDLSAAGARIAFDSSATVVDRFTLVMPGKDRRVAACIVRRGYGEAGVAFQEVSPDAERPYDLPSVTTEERLRASEARRRILQARLDRLDELA